MRLTVVMPGSDDYLDLFRQECARWVAPGTDLDLVTIIGGTAAIASRSEVARAVPAILDQVLDAAENGADGVFIACSGDPAVDAAREIVDIPVVGGFQPALLTALAFGERISVLSVLPNVVPIFRDLVRREGLDRRCQSVRVIDAPVLSLQDHTTLVNLLHAQASRAVADGEADVIVLGCTGFLGTAAALQARLAADGVFVPVVDPTGAALLWLESAVRLGLRPSRTTYAPPPVMTWLP